MKIQAILVAVALLMVAGAASANHDDDGLDDGTEALVCGFPSVYLAINSLGGAAGRCSADYDYQNGLLGLGGECDAAFRCAALLYESSFGLPSATTPPVVTPPVEVDPLGPIPIPFLDPDTVVLHGYREDTFYCIYVESADFTTPGPRCINLSGFAGTVPPISLPLMPYDDLGYTPGHNQGPINVLESKNTDPFRLDLSVTAHWNKDHLNERLTGFPGVWEPVDLLSTSELLWWQSHGQETGLEVSWQVVDLDGNTVEGASDTQTIPYLGQVLAALYKMP